MYNSVTFLPPFCDSLLFLPCYNDGSAEWESCRGQSSFHWARKTKQLAMWLSANYVSSVAVTVMCVVQSKEWSVLTMEEVEKGNIHTSLVTNPRININLILENQSRWGLLMVVMWQQDYSLPGYLGGLFSALAL